MFPPPLCCELSQEKVRKEAKSCHWICKETLSNWFHWEIMELWGKKASMPLVYGWLALWTLAKLIQTAFYVKYFNSTGKVCACLHSWGIITVSIEPRIPAAPALSCLTNTKTGEFVHSSHRSSFVLESFCRDDDKPKVELLRQTDASVWQRRTTCKHKQWKLGTSFLQPDVHSSDSFLFCEDLLLT